jgi:hypothetical protein
MIKRDLVQRLRDTAVPTVELCDEAADAIERLRLTDAEREAVEYAAAFIHAKGLHRQSPSMVADAATLRGLLERLK